MKYFGLLTGLLLFSCSVLAQPALSLEELYSLAMTHYPTARQSSLLKDRSDLEISVLQNGKLPKIDLNSQITYQSEVINFPVAPNSAAKSQNKDQYRASLDINQLIFNGGTIDANSDLKRAELQVAQQQVAVNLYQLKSRINQYYFSVLLLQEQQDLLNSKDQQLQSRIKEVKTGIRYGAVLPASEDVLEAERLNIRQQLSQLKFEREKAINNLSSLVNKVIPADVKLSRPQPPLPAAGAFERPEVRLFDLRKTEVEFSKTAIAKSARPRLYSFAQAGFGNPGLNILDNSFHDFYIIGLKATWNVFDWGNLRAKQKALSLTQDIIETEKATFRLNNNTQLKDAEEEIAKLQELLKADREIILLREKVLKSTASQLKNGVITSSQFLTEFNHLYESKVNRQLHELQADLARANYNVLKGEPQKTSR